MIRVTVAEAGLVSARVGLSIGLWTRAVPLLTFLLVINIHLAHNTLLQYSFLSKGDGLPVMGGLLALVIGGGRLPLSLTKRK